MLAKKKKMADTNTSLPPQAPKCGIETFAKSATESGLNTSDRALPVSFTVRTTPVGNAAVEDLIVRYDVFAMADCILYISLDGKLSTRI